MRDQSANDLLDIQLRSEKQGTFPETSCTGILEVGVRLRFER
jgi:hypothetical protein